MQYLDDNSSASSAHFTLQVKMNQLHMEALTNRSAGLTQRCLSRPTPHGYSITAWKTEFLHKHNPNLSLDLQCLFPPLSKGGKLQ